MADRATVQCRDLMRSNQAVQSKLNQAQRTTREQVIRDAEMMASANVQKARQEAEVQMQSCTEATAKAQEEALAAKEEAKLARLEAQATTAQLRTTEQKLEAANARAERVPIAAAMVCSLSEQVEA